MNFSWYLTSDFWIFGSPEKILHIEPRKKPARISPYLLLPEMPCGDSPWRLPSVPLPFEPLAINLAVMANLDSKSMPPIFEGTDCATYFETDIGKVHQKLLVLIIGEFWRSNFDSRCEFPKPPRKSGLTKLAKVEATLWSDILKMLERMHTLGQLHEHPVAAFSGLILSRTLSMFYLQQSSEQVPTAIAIKKEAQRQNRSLEALDNPFSPQQYPFAAKVVGNAIGLSEKLEVFRKDFYMPVIRSRMSVLTVLRELNPHVIKDGKVNRQGRKKNVT